MQDLESPETRADRSIYIGIDVSKSRLDGFIRPQSLAFAVSNDAAGHAQLIKNLRRLPPAETSEPLIIMEATGRYHRALFERLCAAGFKACVINPFQTYSFGKAMGLNTKTDKVDAYMLARFGEAMQPKPKRPGSKALKTLKELIVCRRQFTSRCTALSNQISECNLSDIRRMMKTQLAMIKRHITKCDDKIRALIADDAGLKARFEIILSVPGVGFVNAATLIADMPELGAINEKQAASLLGVAPHANQSGNHCAKSQIRGGRKAVRTVFYMAALSSVRSQNGLKAFHDRLIDRGKPFKVAITAVMRKMIILINALLRDGRKYTPKPA